MDNNFLRFLPLFIQIIAIMTTTSARTDSKYRAGFGDPCSKTIKCKSQSWLACNLTTSQCDCAKPDTMIYSSTREKCVGMIGERCKYSFPSDDESLGAFYEKLDCVDGALCESGDGICACPKGTYEVVEENKCLPVKRLGEVCQASIECLDTLICLNGKCDCATERMVFELTSAACRLKAGESCFAPNNNCVSGSACIDGMCRCVAGNYMSSGLCMPQKGLESDCNTDDECDDSQKLSCIDGKCACRERYTKNSTGLCTLAYGEECSNEDVCSDEFFCTEYVLLIGSDDDYLRGTTCLCPNTELEFYDGSACKGIIGGPCKTEMECTLNAHCMNGVCSCQNGFVEYDRMHCDVAQNFECEPKTGIPCDRLSGLRCKQKPDEADFKCRCPNELDSFDSYSRRCLRRPSYTCKKHTDCMQNRCSFKHPTDSSGRCS